jgi:hypothetical protein
MENPRSTKDRYKFCCPLPGHGGDSNPSFWVHADGVRWKCFPCGEGGGPGKLRGLLGGDLIPRIPKALKSPKPVVKNQERPAGCTLRQLAQAKSLPVEHLRGMGWYDTNWHGIPSVGIPYPNGLRYRVGLTGKQRFRWEKGSSRDLYGKDQIQDTDKIILYVEGETDTAAGTYLGIPTVGVPGVDTWKSEWAKYAEDRIAYLWQEPGKGGETLGDKMSQDVPGLRVIQAPPGVKDVCELLAQAGAGAGDMLRELMAEAQPYYPVPEEEAVVANRAIHPKYCSPIGDNRSDRSELWKAAQEHFPMPGELGQFLWPYLAQLGQRPASPAMPILQPPAQGQWPPALRTRQIERAIHKAGGDDLGWVWINNALERGHYLYLTSAPGLRDFEPVEEVEAVLVDALRAIHPPGRKEELGRFRPYGGSDNWTKRAETTGEEDQDICELLAVSASPTDFVQLEAECRVSGAEDRPIRPYWRGQFQDGLETNFGTEAAIRLAIDLGYRLTKRGRAYVLDANISESREEQVKAVAATIDVPRPRCLGRWSH